MLNLSLGLDLIIIVAFAILMSASFFMGKSKTLHGIVGFSIAVIATEGIGILVQLSGGSNAVLSSSIGIPVDPLMLALGKIFLCAFFFLIIVLRGGVMISHTEDSKYIEIFWTGVLGFALSGLILSVLLSTVTTGGLLSAMFSEEVSPAAGALSLVQVLTIYRELWYVLPALVIVGMGVLQKN